MNSSTAPLVTVVLPTHNRPDLLARALNSLRQQTMRNFEVVVVNDGGEAVQDSIDKAAAELTITLIQYQPPKGAPHARNRGIEASRGTYITYLDDDDIVYPKHLDVLAGHLENNPRCNVAYTDAIRVFQRKTDHGYETISREVFHSQDFNREYFLVASYVAILSVMHRADCLKQTGLFDESLSTHQDLDLWIRLSQAYDFVHIPQVTAEFFERDKGDSITAADKQRRLDNMELLYTRYRSLASPQIRMLQGRVLRKMYDTYGISVPERLREEKWMRE